MMFIRHWGRDCSNLYMRRHCVLNCRLLDKRLGLLVNFNVDNILDGAITRIANGL